MPAFHPSQPALPKSRVRVPYREREREVPKQQDPPPPKPDPPLLWARRLPYKLVQGSLHGHGVKMEPSRSEPPGWKEPKRRLTFDNDKENAGAGAINQAAGRRPAAAAAGKAAAGAGKAPGYAQANNRRQHERAARDPGRARGAPRGTAAAAAAGRATRQARGKATAPAAATRAAAAAGGNRAATATAAAAQAAPSAPAPAPAPPGVRVLRSDTAALRALLQARHFEVECTLRPTLSEAAALTRVRAAVRDALRLDDELGEIATSVHARSKGHLFQALLETLRAAGVDHAQTEMSPGKARVPSVDFRDALGDERWQALATRCDALRKLVRIKVADDNDLRTARAGLVLCNEFFDALAELASMVSDGDEFALLKELSATTA